MDQSLSFESGQRPHFWPLLRDDQLAGVQKLLDSPAAVAAFLPPFLHRHQIAERNFNRLSERQYAEDRYDTLNLTSLDLIDAWNYVRLSFGVAVGIPTQDDEHDEHKHHGLFSKHKAHKTTPGIITLDGRETEPMTDLVQLSGFADSGNKRHRAALASLEPLMRDYPTNKILFETFDIWECVLRDGQVLAYAFKVHGGGAPATLPHEWTVAPRSPAPSFVSQTSSHARAKGREHPHAALAEERDHDAGSLPAFPQHRDPQYREPTARVAFPTPHPAGEHPCPSREHPSGERPLPPLPPGAT